VLLLVKQVDRYRDRLERDNRRGRKERGKAGEERDRVRPPL